VFPFASADGPVLTFDWLSEFTDEQPAVADLIFEAAVGQGSRVMAINGRSVDMTRLGFFAPDRDLIPESDLYRRPDYSWDGYRRRGGSGGVEPQGVCKVGS